MVNILVDQHFIKPVWFKLSWLLFGLFVIGAFLSRSLVNIVLYLMVAMGMFFLWLMLLKNQNIDSSTDNNDETKIAKPVAYLLFWGLIFVKILVLYFAVNIYSPKVALLIFSSLFVPVMIWIVGLYKKHFLAREFFYWLLLNGFLFWFYFTFFLRVIDLNTEYYLSNTLHLSLGLTLPTTLFYLVIKLSKITSYTGLRIENLVYLLYGVLGVLCLVGITNVIFLGEYWPTWYQIANKLDVSITPGRLGSFHFVLDLGNILAQATLVMLGIVFFKYFNEKKPMFTLSYKNSALFPIIGSILLLVFFITTWVKLLIPVFIILLLFFLIMVFRKNFKYIGLSFLFVLGVLGILFSNETFKSLTDDASKALKIIRVDYQNNQTDEIVNHLIETKLNYDASFIYRLQHHFWAFRILSKYPITGIGPFAYTDYVVDHYRNDYIKLPYIFVGNVGETEKNNSEVLDKNINRAILGTHADFVMISTSGGGVGIVLYYLVFIVMLYYFFRRFLRSNNYIFLGLCFALLGMLGSGLTEPNLKPIHMYLLTMYILVFFFDKFIYQKRNDSETKT